jgi:hypothetical protein
MIALGGGGKTRIARAGLVPLEKRTPFEVLKEFWDTIDEKLLERAGFSKPTPELLYWLYAFKGEYTRSSVVMDNKAAKIMAAAELLSAIYPTEQVKKALADLDLAANATREITGRAKGKPRPKNAELRTRTAQELFGVSAASQSRRYHRSKGAEFSAEELADPVLLHAADSVVNARSKRTKNGEALSLTEIETAQRAARFARQARRRREKLAIGP